MADQSGDSENWSLVRDVGVLSLTVPAMLSVGLELELRRFRELANHTGALALVLLVQITLLLHRLYPLNSQFHEKPCNIERASDPSGRAQRAEKRWIWESGPRRACTSLK
jgi:hypothetical protein